MELNHYGITLQQVQDAIQKSNANVGGNILTLGSQSHIVRGIGLAGQRASTPSSPDNVAQRAELIDNKLDDIRNVVVTQYQGNPILVSHVAKVVEGHQPRLGIVGRHHGTQTGKRRRRRHRADAEVRKVAQGLRRGQEEDSTRSRSRSILPAGMKIKIFNERTELVHVTTHNVLHNLLVGMGLVIAILFIFLGDIASAGIVAIMIPLALLFSITVLYVQGKSANLLSIGAVDFGIIVDSSTIIVENIYRHITAPGVDRSRPLIDRIIDASSEIERALLLFDDDHRLRVHPAFLDVRPRRRALRPDGQHLRLRHLRRPADGRDAGPGPLLVLLRQQARGARHDPRQDHEAPLPEGPELGSCGTGCSRSR